MKKINIIYTRVFTHKQKNDLGRFVAFEIKK